jgi:hypothetical protein
MFAARLIFKQVMGFMPLPIFRRCVELLIIAVIAAPVLQSCISSFERFRYILYRQ